MSSGFEKNLDATALSADVLNIVGSFLVNGTFDPIAASNGGSGKGRYAVVRTGTGLYTVTLSAGLTFPSAPAIECSNSIANTGATWSAYVTYPTAAGWQNSARQFQINTALNAAPNTPADIPADGRNRVTFYIEAIDGQGK